MTKIKLNIIDTYLLLQYNEGKYTVYKGSDLMTKKITAILLALCMAISILPMSVQASSKPDIKVGDYVKMGTYNNASILWRCVSIDDNGPLMLADRIIDTLAYDAKTNDNSNSKSHSRSYKRDDYGSNYWKDSNMRSWLNSTAAAGKVDWLCGNPPKDGYVSGTGAYNDKAGFLNAFSKSEIAAMKTVTQRSLVSHPEYNKGIVNGDANSDLYYYTDIAYAAINYDSAYFETTTEKVFLLDVKQANAVWKNLKGYYIAYNSNGMAWPYWLRTPVTDCNHDMRYISSSGEVGRYAPWYSDLGVRPAFYLDSEYFVSTSGSGSQSNPYIGSAPNKQEADYTISEPAEEANPDWNVSTEQSIQLTLGPWYSGDGKYANSTIPVYTIQKTRSDTENMVVVVCGEGYTKSQQGKFINDVKRLWQEAMKYEPYRSYADRFNVYALCTASESTFDNGGSTFFDVIVDKYNSPVISNNLHGSQWKNHIFERCIGPEFIEKIHDAHIKKTTDPNTIPMKPNGESNEYEPYYYVHDYIAQFAMVVNTTNDFGGAYNNREYGFHYFISPSDSYRAPKTFAHELGHSLLGLGDEYSTGYLLEDKELKSLNLSSVEDPEKIKWRQLLGFRNTYTCRNAYGSKMLVSSYECIMRDTNYQFCEVCRLQGFKRMSQLVNDIDLYVAPPEVKEYTGAYSSPSDFTDLETSSYYTYTYNRSDRLLSGNSKSRFNTDMSGKKIELRTVIQNISDKKTRQLKFKMWIKHSDGSVATDSSGNPLQTVQTFDIPTWNDKANFWPIGALDHIKSDFNSGLKSCSLIYQIPSDAQLKNGDTVAFQVLDENGNVLADDNTETQRYTTVSIQYKFEDGSEIPNTAGGTFTVPYGTKLDLTPAKSLYGYKFVKADGLNKPIVSDGTVVTYYYKNKNEEHTHNLTLVAAKAATCTEGGKEAYYKCEGCGKFYEDVLGTKEITDLASWGNIAKIAHTTKQTVTKATPTANGKIVNYCSVCKKTLSTTVITKASSIKLKATSLTYNGKVRTPKVIVKDRTGKTLVKNTDYTVSYAKGRKYVGKYAVKITFKGKYSGTKTLYFTIKPKATSISSLKAGSKKFTVKWKKQATQTTGYQVQYSASSKFSKAKTVTVGKNTTVSKKISKLSGKKKYYVRVRTYKTVKINGKSIRIYSGWSKAKTVTTKK